MNESLLASGKHNSNAPLLQGIDHPNNPQFKQKLLDRFQPRLSNMSHKRIEVAKPAAVGAERQEELKIEEEIKEALVERRQPPEVQEESKQPSHGVSAENAVESVQVETGQNERADG